MPDSTGYDPFGKVTARTGNTGSLGFQGDWTDKDTGQVDMGARWYDPATGGFASRDDVDLSGGSAVGANRYSYGNGSPVANADPTGHYSGTTPPGSVKSPSKGHRSAGNDFKAAGRGLFWGFKLAFRYRKFYSPASYVFWSVLAPTPAGGRGADCGGYCGGAYPPGTGGGNSFCLRQPWVPMCGGSGTGGGIAPARPGTGAGDGGGGGGGNSGPSAAELAYQRAKAISDAARAENEHGAKHNPISVDPGARRPIISGKPPVSSNPSGPASEVGALGNPIKDIKQDVDQIYNAAVRRAGQVLRNVSVASQSAPAPGPSTQPDTDDGSDDGDCRDRLPTPDYGALDRANGNRATGVEACLVAEGLTKGTAPSVNPPGWDWARATALYHQVAFTDRRYWINRCHLLGAQFGGTGADTRNLSTCSRTTNANAIAASDRNLPRNMLNFENDVMAAVKGRQVVEYEVTPLYRGNRTVPYAYRMSAEGVYRNGIPGIRLREMIPNSIYSPRTTGRVNLGEVVHQGKAVPTAGMS